MNRNFDPTPFIHMHQPGIGQAHPASRIIGMSSRNDNLALRDRVRKVRQDLFGDDGMREMADRLELPLSTWENYEWGVTIPALVILKFVALSRVNPDWLLTGEGVPYSHHPSVQENHGNR